jgi:hypothetical protein
LALTSSGAITASPVIDVRAGATLDVSAQPNFALASTQTLMGNGTVNGSLTNNGTLAPGESVGQLTMTANLTLGLTANTIMEVDNAGQTNDQLTVGGTLTYNGTLLISNISGTPYTNNQVLKLFSAGAFATSAFSTITFPGVNTYDASNLTVDGTIKVLTAGSALPSTPTNITVGVSAGQLHLQWPSSYTGWLIQSNAVNVANTNFWFAVPGANATNELFIPIDHSRTNVYFRMLHP